MKVNKILKSISVAVLAQIISLCISLFMSFYVSKFMTIEGFGYYQLFLFYSTYVGIFQFGASEGIYLLNGGKDYSEVNKKQINHLFKNILLVQIIIIAALNCIIQIFLMDRNKKVVFSILFIFIIVNFIVTYFGYLLQATKRIKEYSYAIIVGKVFTLAMFLGLVKYKQYDFQLYCIVYLIGYIISSIVILYKCRDIIIKKDNTKLNLLQVKKVLVSGSSLLLANLISSFIVGVNRLYIERCFGIETFGKVSMALSLSNFFILFAIQIGLVIFPSIITLSSSKKAYVYTRTDFLLGYMIFFIFLAYTPLKYILNLWIPQYYESLQWLLLLIPFTIYEIKNQVLYNTYMKAMRNEKYLFYINIFAFTICAILNLFIVFNLKSIIGAIIVLDLAIICKSLLLNIKLIRQLKINNYFYIYYNIFCILILTFLYYYEVSYRGIYTIVFGIIYSIIYYKNLKNNIH